MYAQVQKDYPHLVAGTSVARKMGFPDVILPGRKFRYSSLCSIFTALHVMQTRYCDEISVRPSVCLSVTRVDCDKTEERSVQIYIPYERTFILVL